MNVIIANAISFVACVIMVFNNYIKAKDKYLAVQTVQLSLSALSCFMLSAYTGLIINLLSVPRNLLAWKDRLKLWHKIVILVLTIIISGMGILKDSQALGYIEWIEFIPWFSTIGYTLLIDKCKGISFKWLCIYTFVVWGFYDFITMNYVAGVFDILSTVALLITIHRIKKDITKPSEGNQPA